MVCAFVAIGPINLNGGIIELANVALQRLAHRSSELISHRNEKVGSQ